MKNLKIIYLVVLSIGLSAGAAYQLGIKEGIKRQVGDGPYQIVVDDLHSLISFDLTTLRCPRCGSKDITKERYGGVSLTKDHFYDLQCKKCGIEGRIVERNTTSRVLIGKVVEVGKVWTKNGDGDLTILTDAGRTIKVSIVGWPGPSEETKIELKSVKYVKDLVGKRIEIIRYFPLSDIMIAKSIREI